MKKKLLTIVFFSQMFSAFGLAQSIDLSWVELRKSFFDHEFIDYEGFQYYVSDEQPLLSCDNFQTALKSFVQKYDRNQIKSEKINSIKEIEFLLSILKHDCEHFLVSEQLLLVVEWLESLKRPLLDLRRSKANPVDSYTVNLPEVSIDILQIVQEYS